MKTNPTARWIVKAQRTMLCLAVGAIMVAELSLSGPLASRVGQAAATRTEVPQAPNVSVGDFVAAIR